MKYRSNFEAAVHLFLGDEWEFEPHSLEYSVPRKYTPDFVHKNFIVEAKGYFREGDTQKYRAIHDQTSKTGQKLVFVLMNPNKKVRKGATLTMSGWCDKNDIPWFTMETLNELKEWADEFE